MSGADWFTAEQEAGFRQVAENAKAIRDNKAGLDAMLSTQEGADKLGAMVQQMRTSVASLNALSRELSKTADVIANARRKRRLFGIRA